MNVQTRRFRHAGFTLTEVLVSVPLLILVFWIISNIFTVTRDTVDMGMVHSKITASGESAVQRMARDLAGLRADGRLVIMASRPAGTRGVSRQDPDVLHPGTWGQMAFIAQGTWISQYDSALRGNMARIWYRPSRRVDFTQTAPYPPLNFHDCQVLMRDIKLYIYNVSLDRYTVPADWGTNPIRRPTPPAAAPNQWDTLAWQPTAASIGGVTFYQQRTDLMRMMINAFRFPDPAQVQNNNAPFPLQQTGGAYAPDFGPDLLSMPDTIDPVAMQQVMLMRCALMYNGAFPTPDNFQWAGNPPSNANPMGPPGVLNPDPSPVAALRDPGATCFFQWWGRDVPNDVENWHPTASEIPTGGVYYRKFMTIKDPEDQAEWADNTPPFNGTKRGPNLPPAAPGEAQVNWPTAIRISFMMFDKVGRFRRGALYQATVDVPTHR